MKFVVTTEHSALEIMGMYFPPIRSRIVDADSFADAVAKVSPGHLDCGRVTVTLINEGDDDASD